MQEKIFIHEGEKNMKFPNAFAGVKKLYIAEILAIIALILTLITTVAAFFTIGVIDRGLEEAVNPSLVVTGVFAIVTAILVLIAFVLDLVGLSQAGKDEPTFKYALIVAIVGIVASAASSFLPDGAGKELLTLLYEIGINLVAVFSIAGIMALAKKSMNAEMEERGTFLLKLIIASIIIANVADIIYRFFANGAVVLGIVAIVIDLAASLLYLGYLNRARKMLEE